MNGSDTYIKGQYDDQGRKQGKWEHQYRGEVKYTYLFKDDVCTKGIKMNVQTGDVSDARFEVVEEYWGFQRRYDLEDMIRRSRYHGWGVGGSGKIALSRKPKDEIQNNDDVLILSQLGDSKAKSISEEKTKVYGLVEQMPEFPGGTPALKQYLAKNITYPTIAQENGTQGKVIVQFVVLEDGSIANVEVMRSVDPSLDQEAARVVETCPKWIPGRQNGTPVAVKYSTPVVFRLQ